MIKSIYIKSLLIGSYVAFAVSVSKAAVVVSEPGVNYTFDVLSHTDGSGVTKLADGEYSVASDIVIESPATFSLSGASVVRLADNVTVEINCRAELDGGDGRVLVTRIGEADAPRGFSIGCDDEVLSLKNIDFEYASLRNMSATGFDVDNCTFSLSNGRLSSMGALTLGTSGAAFNITNCSFTDNTVPAIGGAANYACGLYIADCTFVNNNTSNTNKPQINVTVGGDRPVTITRCTLTGSGLNMVGGIAVGNLTIMSGTNEVNITDCTITDHRYGITGVGPMSMSIRDNMLKDNNHETNAMNGGSGISLSGYGYQLDAVLSGNHIENSLWGVTVINCGDVSLGNIDDPLSPGNNTFVNNGNGGVQYDLYNNSAKTIYAQNNTWAVPEQTAELIETVIFHKTDNPSLGEVVFMPAHQSDALAAVELGSIGIVGGRVLCPSPVDVYDAAGRLVVAKAVNPEVDTLAPGMYVARAAGAAVKFRIP